MNFRPTTDLPRLNGLGVNAAIARPDGTLARQYRPHTWLVWADSAAWIEHEGIRINLDPHQVAGAAGSMASFVDAMIHRRLYALEGLLDVCDDEWTCAIVTAARSAA